MILPKGSSKEILVLDHIKGIFSALIIYTCPRNVHTLYNYKKIPEKAFMYISAVSILLIIFSKTIRNIPYIYVLIFGIMSLTIFYAFLVGYLFKFKYKKADHDKKSLVIWVISIITFIFVVTCDLFSFMTIISSQMASKFHFLPLAYICFCIAHINLFKNDLLYNKSISTRKLSDFGITNRENEVLNLIIRGYKYIEIADKLCISLSTVKKHITNVYKKTNTSNKVELITLINM